MSKIRKGYADTAEGQIHFCRSEGGSGAPLVFLHMTAASNAAYHGVMELLAGKRPLIAFDTVNYGESYRTTREPTLDYIASVMLEALSNLGVERFHTFGHHTGASVQVEMAVKAPQRVLSTILNGPTYARPSEMAYFKDMLATRNPVTLQGTQFMVAWSRSKDNMGRTMWRDIPNAAEILNRDTVDMLRAGENWAWGYRAVFEHDLVDTMTRVKCPMFLICGRNDIAFPYHMRAVADYPNAAHYEHETGGVYYAESHPEDIAPRIEAFLSSLK